MNDEMLIYIKNMEDYKILRIIFIIFNCLVNYY